MGRADLAVNQMMERKEVFADFVNGVIYGGRQVVKQVVTIVMYSGNEWDGAVSLHELLDIDERAESTKALKRYIPDYKINLVCTQDVEAPNVFGSCLQQIFGMLKWKKDKKRLYR